MHTNHTTNYELSQFVSADKPTFLGDYNGDMLKIDTAIAGVATTASGAVSTANAASATATDAATAAASAASTAATADANASSALATAGNAATAAAAAQSDATAASTAASAADTKATAANTAIGDLAQLTTTDKTSLVDAVNEVNAKPSGASTAAGVSYDNTNSGLTAENVQAAIDEVVTMLPSTGEYIEVTADGVKTYGALLTELYALLDASKLTANSKYTQSDPTIGTISAVYVPVFINTDNANKRAVFSRSMIGTNTARVDSVELNASCKASRVDGGTVTTLTNEVQAANTKFRITY